MIACANASCLVFILSQVSRRIHEPAIFLWGVTSYCLRERKQTLKKMKDKPISGRSSSILEGVVKYDYCNYSVQKATEDYKKIADEYAKAHTALDLINVTGEIEVDW